VYRLVRGVTPPFHNTDTAPLLLDLLLISPRDQSSQRDPYLTETVRNSRFSRAF
jgi:hypothetical protein